MFMFRMTHSPRQDWDLPQNGRQSAGRRASGGRCPCPGIAGEGCLEGWESGPGLPFIPQARKLKWIS